MSGPDSVTTVSPVTFTVGISGGDAKIQPTFNWSISAGSIGSGQRTSSIIVPTIGLAIDGTFTATVDIGGLDRNCPTAGSVTTMIVKKP